MATETTAAGHKETAAEGIILLFELENVALPGRKRLYEILKKNIPAAGVQLNPGLFSRYGLKPTPELSVASLAENAGSGKGDADKIGSEVNAAYVSDLRQKSTVNTAVVKLLESAAKKGFILGALSALTEEDATAVVARLELSAEIKLLAHKPDEPSFPRADNWIKLLKSVSKSSQPAVAIVSSQAACKSALAAGLRVVVLPDEFTGHQDFGGADIIVDSAADISVNDIIATLSVS
jgi:beta-phosphoglucomutase-like phosphatase (HAD superfamily)